jgi:ankyrin repeat protein
MDKIPAEILTQVADNVDFATLRCWMLTAHRYNTIASKELYRKALAIDRDLGWPYHLTRAALLNRVTNAFQVLLRETDLDFINKATIDVQKNLREYNFALLFPIFQYVEPYEGYSPPQTTLLHIACQLCNEDVLAELLFKTNMGAAISDTCGWTPLHLAAWSGRDSVIRLLLEAGAQVNIRGSPTLSVHISPEYASSTPLQAAVAREHISSTKILLDASAELKSNQQLTLTVAAGKGNLAIMKLLLECNPDKDFMTKALFSAARVENVECVKLLVNAGADPRGGLMHATASNQVKNLRFLLDLAGDLREYEGRNLIMCHLGGPEVTKMTLDDFPGLAASIIPQQRQGTPLEALYMNTYGIKGREETMSTAAEETAVLLVKDGCLIRDPETQTSNYRAPSTTNVLLQAARWGHPRVIKELLRRKPSLLAQNDPQSPLPLFCAVESMSKNKLECFKLLEQHGCDIHKTGQFGTLLMDHMYVSSSERQTERQIPFEQNASITKYLIDAGYSFDPCSDGEAALIKALRGRNDESAMVLMDAGANIYAMPYGGQPSLRYDGDLSTLQHAAKSGCFKSMSRLLQAVDLDRLLPNNHDNTLLHLAVHNSLTEYYDVDGYHRMIAHILLGEVGVPVRDLVSAGDDLTRLEILVKGGWIKVIRKLCIEGIVDPGSRDRLGSTAFEGIVKRFPEAINQTLRDKANEKWLPPIRHSMFTPAF